MGIKFHAPTPWIAIGNSANGVKAHIAVPFLGKGAATMLPIAPGSVLVTRFTRDAVKGGQVDPREVIKFIRRGVTVFNQPDLHAKVYVFPRKAFVGSANVSKSSENLIEACLETSEIALVRQAREFVRSLDSDLVTPEYAKSLTSLYPTEGERYFGTPNKNRKAKEAEEGKFWVTPVTEVVFSAEAKKANRKGKPQAVSALTDKSSYTLDTIHQAEQQFQKGDWLLQRLSNGRGFIFECPARIVHLEMFAGPSGQEQLVYVEKPKRQRDISSTVIRSSLKELVKKICFPANSNRQLKSAKDIAQIKRLWSAFRAE